jgi:hypothetical protein
MRRGLLPAGYANLNLQRLTVVNERDHVWAQSDDRVCAGVGVAARYDESSIWHGWVLSLNVRCRRRGTYWCGLSSSGSLLGRTARGVC